MRLTVGALRRLLEAGGPDDVVVSSKFDRTIFECRCCGNSTWGRTDGSFDEPGWGRLTGIDGPKAICPECLADPEHLESALAEFREDGYPNVRVDEPASVQPVRESEGFLADARCSSCGHRRSKHSTSGFKTSFAVARGDRGCKICDCGGWTGSIGPTDGPATVTEVGDPSSPHPEYPGQLCDFCGVDLQRDLPHDPRCGKAGRDNGSTAPDGDQPDPTNIRESSAEQRLMKRVQFVETLLDDAYEVISTLADEHKDDSTFRILSNRIWEALYGQHYLGTKEE